MRIAIGLFVLLILAVFILLYLGMLWWSGFSLLGAGLMWAIILEIEKHDHRFHRWPGADEE